ncbi:hypothetical protein DFJ74DRAFT_693138 [Hyaloraphidium curvatum]|nr:hypothetical protein DFJ74DRAFT_693138 [Hyaloraphidium curvatum]
MAGTARPAASRLPRLAWLLLALPVFLGLLSAARAERPSWNADVRVELLGGPVPAGRSAWRQCARMDVANPAELPGAWEGTLEITGGAVVSVADGCAASLRPLRGEGAPGTNLYELDPWEGVETAIAAKGEAQRVVEFCVAYRSAWSAVPRVRVVAPEDYVEAPSGVVGQRRLVRRGEFYADWSTGQCRCRVNGRAGDQLPPSPPPPAPATSAAPPPPPPTSTATQTLTRTATTLTSTTSATETRTRTTTTSFTSSTTTATPSPRPPILLTVSEKAVISNSSLVATSVIRFVGVAEPISSANTVQVYMTTPSNPAPVSGSATSIAGTGRFSFNTTSLADGVYIFTFTTWVGSTQHTVTIDTTTPPNPILTSVNGQNPEAFDQASTGVLTFEGTARAGDKVNIYANSTDQTVIVGTNVTRPDSGFTVVTESVDDGSYIYSVRSESPAGAVSPGAAFVAGGQNITIAKPGAAASQGCLLLAESFGRSSVDVPNFIALGDTCLTGMNASETLAYNATNNLRGCPRTNPVAPVGYLQLTSQANWQSGAILLNDEIRGGDGFEVTMDLYQYGGSGADGIAFFLVKGETNLVAAGGFGGSLGYAQYNGGGGLRNGVSGAYVGIGFDAFGNFARDTEGRGSGTPGGNCTTISPHNAAQAPNAITVRGPGNGTLGYCWLATAVLPNQWQTNGRMLRAGTLATAQRTARLTVSPTDANGDATFKVEMNYYDGVGWRTELTVPAPKPVPDSYKFGLASGTGAQNDFHLVRNLVVKSRKMC